MPGNFKEKAQVKHSEQELEKARRIYEESERVLNILRAQTASPIRTPTDEEIIQWQRKLKTKKQDPFDID